VVPLDRWLDDGVLQAIANENNLSETAFYVPDPERGDRFHLRWFTPAVEVDLCGHATLATAHVILRLLEPERDAVEFTSRSGALTVRKRGEWLELDFPSRPPAPGEAPASLVPALTGAGGAPVDVQRAGDNFLVVYAREEDVAALAPDFAALEALACGVIATAPGRACDFVSRYFVPYAGIDEDPVTGSAHCTLAPYWSRRLGKRADTMWARQISARGGELRVEDRGERVGIAGRSALYLEGVIHLD
jgi:PhzF family phenazine biosynthesis protein